VANAEGLVGLTIGDQNGRPIETGIFGIAKRDTASFNTARVQCSEALQGLER